MILSSTGRQNIVQIMSNCPCPTEEWLSNSNRELHEKKKKEKKNPGLKTENVHMTLHIGASAQKYCAIL